MNENEAITKHSDTEIAIEVIVPEKVEVQVIPLAQLKANLVRVEEEIAKWQARKLIIQARLDKAVSLGVVETIEPEAVVTPD